MVLVEHGASPFSRSRSRTLAGGARHIGFPDLHVPGGCCIGLERGIFLGKLQVAATDGEQSFSGFETRRFAFLNHHVGELLETTGSNGDEQAFHTLKVVGGCGVRDAGTCGTSTQGQTVCTTFPKNVDTR